MFFFRINFLKKKKKVQYRCTCELTSRPGGCSLHQLSDVCTSLHVSQCGGALFSHVSNSSHHTTLKHQESVLVSPYSNLYNIILCNKSFTWEVGKCCTEAMQAVTCTLILSPYPFNLCSKFNTLPCAHARQTHVRMSRKNSVLNRMVKSDLSGSSEGERIKSFYLQSALSLCGYCTLQLLPTFTPETLDLVQKNKHMSLLFSFLLNTFKKIKISTSN